MKIAISGASGFIGSHLTDYFTKKGYQVVSLRRELFSDKDSSELYRALIGSDVVINLAGASIAHRWTKRYKEEIYSSRIDTTRRLVDTINSLQRKPSLLISTSAVGYYNSTGNYTEATAKIANSFLSTVCQDWEEQARRVSQDVRCVITRFGVVFSDDGGVFPKMTQTTKYKFMVRIGSGDQYISWIAIDDLVRAFDFVITNEKMAGVVNFTAPRPMTNGDFAIQVAHYYGSVLIFSVPEFLLRKIMGEQSVLITDGQRVYPERLIRAGFEFKVPSLIDFLESLSKKNAQGIKNL